ncbi:MAG: M23 family metallopeptidase [Deltaproteobacteria bacterium]|nr:M23 family metallopeptidase [Deltaproteobacteria bacterium]
MRGILIVVLAAVLLGAGAFGFYRCEGSPPSVETPTSLAVGREPKTASLVVSDEGSGLRDIVVSLQTPAGEKPLAARELPGGWLGGSGVARETIDVPLDAKAIGLADGQVTLRVVARDWSWRTLTGGGRTVVETPVTIDTKPPRVSVENTQTYLQRGGSGLAVYRVSDDSTRDGVMVGDLYFRGHPFPGEADGRRLAFFAIPQDAPADPAIRVVAEDAAGNRAQVGWATHFKERRFPDVKLDLGPQFLENKVTELASARGIDATDRVAAFQRINSAGRAEDEKKIRELTSKSAEEKLWNGAFEQLRNSKVTSQFAEKRSYFVEGQQVSQATHYGFDLATTLTSPVTASNAGRVVFADDLGIYGGCVIVDHGYDLFTLYGHLSRIDVKAGDAVSKGQPIGLSGATGLAGGDHLHFATLLDGVYVDPVEWWDPKWIREKVDALLVTAPASPAVAAEPGGPAAVSAPAPARTR